MTQQAPTGEKKQNPLVPYLRLPQSPGEQPYLWGSKCKSCGAVYTGKRMACSKCFSTEPMEEMRFSNRGRIWTFTVVHQSAPGIPTPYIAAVVDLPEGVSVKTNIDGLDPLKPDRSWLGMEVEMFTEKVRTDREGNDIIAYKFRPVKG